MKFYNINQPDKFVSLKEAVLTGIQGSEGLYMPQSIPTLSQNFFDNLSSLSLQEIAFEVSKNMLGDDLSDDVIKSITQTALNFKIPLVQLEENVFVLELFHGPTLAFKDVGARFMAGLFEHFLKADKKQIHILVATSGDTGGAVANAFWDKEGIDVTILYPKGKVSPLQELQLTTLGGNVKALEVEGSFDDCQRMVKQAFADTTLQQRINLASANSINFARLFPQSFYYFYAYAQLKKNKDAVVISVPSGNFGNLTAGLLARKMGLPVQKFIAANNANRVVSNYLHTGNYQPAPSVQTISNAMDVGAPSNFSRMLELYQSDWNKMKNDIAGLAFSDEETRNAIKEVHKRLNYTLDPHGAVAYMALKKYLEASENTTGIFFETAHPSKFMEVVESTLQTKIEIPEVLSLLQSKTSNKKCINADYAELKTYLTDSL